MIYYLPLYYVLSGILTVRREPLLTSIYVPALLYQLSC